jgi:hypothetical protein
LTGGEPEDTVRDVEHRELIETSKRLRDQLSAAVTELERYVQALQTEIERKRSGLRHRGDG